MATSGTKRTAGSVSFEALYLDGHVVTYEASSCWNMRGARDYSA